MKTNYFPHTFHRLSLVALVMVGALASSSRANPTGMTVAAGAATAQTSGSQLNITTSPIAFLNWNSFNIQAGETTTFIQPSANAVVFNEIGGANPSQIYGNLNANGTVILANANGFYFGPNSMIKVGGDFIATTAPITPDFGAGSSWTFTGMPPLASIINYGSIQAGNGRALFLIAENIQNNGSLIAPGGNIGLAAGQTVLVSERPDGRGLSASVQVPAGSVNNLGQIIADAGIIALQAQVVNQNGIIQADSVQNQNGEIELVASSQLNLAASSQILARGDDSTPGSAGGNVTLKSGNTFSDNAGSVIVTAGGTQGGNGGNVEISAPAVSPLNSAIDASAQTGWAGGQFYLGLMNLVLGGTAGVVPDPNGTINAINGFGTTYVNVGTAFKNITAGQILLEASGNISLAANTTWNLTASTGNRTTGQLILEAGGNIVFGNGAKIIDANNWSVTLAAGYNFANGAVESGVGNIFLNNNSGGTTGGGWIQTAGGSINLIAGQNVLVGSGSVFTTAGGGIFVDALAGNINAGSWNGGSSYTTQTSDYQFRSYGSVPNAVLGGFSTAAGGNVTLIAGNNIDSTPMVPANQWPGASGAYGSGNVTVIAGNQITGNYTLANGTGVLLAGVPVSAAQAAHLQNPSDVAYASTLAALENAAQQSQDPNGNIGAVSSGGAITAVTLGLISGSWNAWAANNLYLNEVNNPNGTFNKLDSYLFNYAADAAVHLWAGNAIELTGGNLARNGNPDMQPIYAPILTLVAGAGGITVDNSIFLYPSSQGALSITTLNGGDLSGAVTAGSTTLVGITMSGSGPPTGAEKYEYQAIQNYDQATIPLHLNDPNPVVLDISGSIGSFQLNVPTFAEITVDSTAPYVIDGQNHLGTYNFGFTGFNLSPLQTTFIKVLNDGNIAFPDYTPGATFGGQGLVLTGPGNFNVTALNIDLGFSAGVSLQSPTVVATSVTLTDPLPAALFDPTLSGNPELASKLQYDAATGRLTFVGLMSPAELAFLLNPTVLNAQGVLTSVTLDATQLAAINQLYNNNRNDVLGANLNLTTTGNLVMTSTEIANYSLLGGITLHIGGLLDVGGESSVSGDQGVPKGIFTTGGGGISVTAGGTVNVDGSRIATYNGGDINISSQNGDVIAGSGGMGSVSLTVLELDPVTGELTGIPADVPGSGILAITLPGSHATLGNIIVRAPNGDIDASLGGVLQLAFNGQNTQQSFVSLNAGHDINSTGSGVIGYNIELQAGGNINGIVVGRQSVAINSQNNVDVTVVSGGNVNINASGEVSGTVISGGNLDVSGNSITASLIAESVSAYGDTSGASLGIPQSNIAKENTEAVNDTSAGVNNSDDLDDDKKRKGKGITLAQKTSRVTVLLPPRQQPRTPDPGT